MDTLFLGVGRHAITPEVGCRLFGYTPDIYSESVADDLNATVFYFQQSDRRCLMISLDVCSFEDLFAKQLFEQIEKEFGIPGNACIMSAIHTHSGPALNGIVGWGDPDYTYIETIFIPGVMTAVKKALAHPVAAEMGWSCGESLVGVNRRQLNLNNTISLGQNPWGPFEPRMRLISFRDLQGKCLANLVHYGAHATAAGKNHEISRDWPGVMIDALEAHTGGITAFFNGPEGDVGPRLSNGDTVGNMHYVRELGAVAAEDAIRIYNKIDQYNTPQLRICEHSITIPLQPRMPPEEARTLYEQYKDCTTNMSAYRAATALAALQAHENGIPNEAQRHFSQNMIQLNNLIFVSSPFELFSEIGMRIDREFPEHQVMNIINANGSHGYVVTQDAICRGGYEVRYHLYRQPQPFCDDADGVIVTQTVKNIQTMLSKED